MEPERDRILITDFSNLASAQWEVVDDVVMGGRSHGHFQLLESGHALFSGNLSLKNNGGFSSVKNRKRINIEGAESIRLKVKGDGNRYSFRFRTGRNGQTHRFVYESRFNTAPGEWETILLNLSEFEAVFRGRPVPDAPPPDLSSIHEYGFLISDKQEGGFRLEIASVEAVLNK
ncbi:MAG: CIA30 family protein [Bacteroidetes bacterium]|jgi:hypothetical protein|nr:CIA30 family protein [Bacteroidota bacterium]